MFYSLVYFIIPVRKNGTYFHTYNVTTLQVMNQQKHVNKMLTCCISIILDSKERPSLPRWIITIIVNEGIFSKKDKMGKYSNEKRGVI